MKRFDAQTDLIEKKFEDQRTFNEEIALEVTQLGRRVAADVHGKTAPPEEDLASPRPRSQADPLPRTDDLVPPRQTRTAELTS